MSPAMSGDIDEHGEKIPPIARAFLGWPHRNKDKAGRFASSTGMMIIALAVPNMGWACGVGIAVDFFIRKMKIRI